VNGAPLIRHVGINADLMCLGSTGYEYIAGGDRVGAAFDVESAVPRNYVKNFAFVVRVH
jgi:hypothetical protein